MEEQFSFDINLDFLDTSTMTPQQNGATTAGYQQGHVQTTSEIESFATRIASVNDLVVQLKTVKEEYVKLQKQMQDLSDSAMSIRCMYEREKTEKAKYALLSKELQEKCDQAESQLTNKTLHFEQLTSKIEQSNEKGPISYNELAVRYQRLAVQLEEDKLLNHKEKTSLQQMQEYIEAKKLTTLPSFKKKVNTRKQVHDYAVQCNLKVETKTQGTQYATKKSTSTDLVPLKKEMCTQGTQYTWYTTTRGTNTPAFNSPQKEVRTQGTQYISSTTTRGTCTSAFIKMQSIGTNFPEVVPVSIEDILKEMISDVSPLSPMIDNPHVEDEVLCVKKVEMNTIGTNTGLKNVRKPIDYVSSSIKHSDSRPPSRNINDRIKNESPFMSMPTMNPFVGLGMSASPMHSTVAELWNMLGHTIFAILQNGSASNNLMNMNMANDRMRNLNADMARRRERQQSRDEGPTPGKNYFEEDNLISPRDYLPACRDMATSPILSTELENCEEYILPAETLHETEFFDGTYIDPAASSSAFVSLARSRAESNKPIEIPKILLNKSVQEKDSRIESKSDRSSDVDEILKLFPEDPNLLQKRKAIKRLLKKSKKDMKINKMPTVSCTDEESGIQTQKMEAKQAVQNNTNSTSSEESYFSDESTIRKRTRAESVHQTFNGIISPEASLIGKRTSAEMSNNQGFLGFEEDSDSILSDEVFCKPFLPPMRRQTQEVSNPFHQNIEQALERRGLIDIKPHRQTNSSPTRSVSSKKTKRKRRKSTSDAKQSAKIHKMDESNWTGRETPSNTVFQTQGEFNTAEQESKPSMFVDSISNLNMLPAPSQEMPLNSSLSNQKTSNFNKRSTPRLFKPSNSVLRAKGNQNLNGTIIQREEKPTVQNQKTLNSPAQPSRIENLFDTVRHSQKPLNFNNKRNWDFYGEPNWDFNEISAPDPSLRAEKSSNSNNSSTSRNELAQQDPTNWNQNASNGDSNERQNKSADRVLRNERPRNSNNLSGARHGKPANLLTNWGQDKTENQKALYFNNPSAARHEITQQNPRECDFSERQEKSTDPGIQCEKPLHTNDPSSQRRKVSATSLEKSINLALQAQRTSNLNNLVAEGEGDYSTYPVYDQKPEQENLQKSVFKDKETVPGQVDIVGEQVSFNPPVLTAPKKEEPQNDAVHNRGIAPGASVLPDRRRSISPRLLPEQEKPSICVFQKNEIVQIEDNPLIFIHHDQRTSKLTGLPTPKQENSVLHDQEALNFNGLSDLSEENSIVQTEKQQHLNDFSTPWQEQLPNSTIYNQRTVPGPKGSEEKPANKIFHHQNVLHNDSSLAPEQEKSLILSSHNQMTIQSGTLPEERVINRLTAPQEIQPSTNGRLTIEAALPLRKKEYPSTSSFSPLNSSDSEADLSIDCPQSPDAHNNSSLDLSSLLKTPEKDYPMVQFKTPDSLNKSTSLSKVLTCSTENLVEDFLLNENPETDEPKFQKFLTKILDEVAPPLSPISVLAPTEKNSEPESSCTEEDAKHTEKVINNRKSKRKPPATAAIAVKRSARLKAKYGEDTDTPNLLLLNVPGIQLGKYTKKRTEQKNPSKKLEKNNSVKAEKVDKKVDIICDIRLGYFKESAENEMEHDSSTEELVIDEVPEEIRQPKEDFSKNAAKDLNTFQQLTQQVSQESKEICQTDIPTTSFERNPSLHVESKNKSISNLRAEELCQHLPTVDSYGNSCQETSPMHAESKRIGKPWSGDKTQFVDQSEEFSQRKPLQVDSYPSCKIYDEKPKLILEDPSPTCISFNECPASPSPLDQRAEDTHITQEYVDSAQVTAKPTSSSIISHIIANYDPKYHQMLIQVRSTDKKLVSQLQSVINGFTSGFCLVMDSIRTMEAVLNITNSEISIAQAIIGIVKTAPRPETEMPPPIPELHLSETHRKLLSLLEPLHSRLPNLRRNLQSVIEQSLFTFTKDIISIEVLMNLTQFYLAIIANPMAPNNPARLFICKCLYFYNQKATPMIYETLCVYPSVLPKRDDVTYDRSDALINTIQCILTSTYYDVEKTDLKTREMLTKLRKFYNYESFKPPRDEVIENLMAKIRAGRFKNVSYSFALICKRMDQKNSEKVVLTQRLLPLANEYYHTLSQTTKNDEKIACVLECISFIIKPFSVGTDISIYINLFGRFLNACERQIIQEAALAALLRTIRFGYVNCFNAIYNFKPNYELANTTKAMLTSFLYKKNLDFLKRLEHQARVLVAT